MAVCRGSIPWPRARHTPGLQQGESGVCAMAWDLTITCDGCGAAVDDVNVRWRRSGYTNHPDHLFHPYDGTLPAGWGWHDDDDGDGCYCPACRADDVPGDYVDLRESDHFDR